MIRLLIGPCELLIFAQPLMHRDPTPGDSMLLKPSLRLSDDMTTCEISLRMNTTILMRIFQAHKGPVRPRTISSSVGKRSIQDAVIVTIIVTLAVGVCLHD